MKYLRIFPAILCVSFALSCNGQFAEDNDVPLKASKYQSEGTTLNLHYNGDAVLCDAARLTRKTGTWLRSSRILTLDFKEEVTYGNREKTDSVVAAVSSRESWDIRTGESGFHRLTPLGNGSFKDESYIDEGGGAQYFCTFQ